MTDRPGRVRVIEDGALRDEPWATLDVAATGGAWLMGIALGPDFAETGRGTDPTVLVRGLPNERFRRNQDELNVLLPGETHGWPGVSGVEDDEPFVTPLAGWSPASARRLTTERPTTTLAAAGIGGVGFGALALAHYDPPAAPVVLSLTPSAQLAASILVERSTTER